MEIQNSDYQYSEKQNGDHYKTANSGELTSEYTLNNDKKTANFLSNRKKRRIDQKEYEQVF